MKDYYAILGVPTDASLDEIKQAHRKLALKYHPDKGGSSAQFHDLNEAYETLRDPVQRKTYDHMYHIDHDKDDIDADRTHFKAPTGSFDASVFMNMISNVMGTIAGNKQAAFFGNLKNEPIRVTVPLTLEQACSSKECDVTFLRSERCTGCDGKVSKSGRLYQCSNCKGKGFTPLVPFIAHVNNIKPCAECSCTGSTPPPHDCCDVCAGSGVIRKQVSITMNLTPDMVDSRKAVLVDQGGYTQYLSLKPADVSVTLALQAHEGFSLDGPDLVTSVTVSLAQALCGARVRIRHPKGNEVVLKLARGSVIHPNQVHTIKRLGLPTTTRDDAIGDLHVYFDVVFPETMSDAAISLIERALDYDGKQATMAFHTHIIRSE